MGRACSSASAIVRIAGNGGIAGIGLALVLVLAVGAAGAVGAGCGGANGPRGGAQTGRVDQAESLGDPAAPATDNVRRASYVGTAACAACHAELVRTFVQSPMHNMTRALGAAHPETLVHAPFDGGAAATFRFHDDVAIASAQDGERFVVVERANPPSRRRYRVTKVIGGRVREDFVGVEVADRDAAQGNAGATNGAPAASVSIANEERVLPISWLIGERRWRYKGYSVMTRERPRFGEGAVWRSTCIACHNTATLLDAQAAGIAAARPSATTPVGAHRTRRIASPAPWPDRLLPSNAQRTLMVIDADRLDTWSAQTDARVASFVESDLVELGIGCEACHAGGRMHVADPRVRPSFEPVGAPYKWTESTVAHGSAAAQTTGSSASEGAKAMRVNRACSRCHQVLFSGYPWTWEGGSRARSPGGSSTTSGEARDFLLGACAQKMDCTNCHDPHGGTARAAEDAMASPAGNARCTSCHPQYASEGALRKHAHHDPRGAGGACIACHLAKKNMGLDGQLTRYHRIGSPTDSERVLFDRPLECALCHADKSARSIVETMEAWFGRRYERAPLEALYGDLDQPVLLSTLKRGKAHEKAVAMDLLGRAGDRRVLGDLLGEAGDAEREPYPIVRDYAREAIVRIDPAIALPPRDAVKSASTGIDTEED